MIEVTAALVRRAAPSNPDPAGVARILAPVLARHQIDRTPERLAMFLGQWAHESNFVAQAENLNYSARRLRQVWPSRFPTQASAVPFAYNPRALANKVYNGRMGNRVGTDDGWNYRGKGWPQLTGRNAYRLYGDDLGLNLVADPDLMLRPEVSAAVCGQYWTDRGLNRLTDAGDIQGVTRGINGGYNGLVDREARYRAVLAAIPAHAPQVLLVDAGGTVAPWNGKPDRFGGEVLTDALIAQLRTVYPLPGGPFPYAGLLIWNRQNGDMVLERAKTKLSKPETVK